MRPLALLLLLALTANSAGAAEPSPPPTWPLWDGNETVEQYARRAGLETTKTLDLGNGVKMEMVLIPAGKFVMGTEEPTPVDEAAFKSKILTGQIALAVGGLALLAMIGLVAVRAIRRRQRPQFSLAYLLVMTVAAGVGLLGGLHWRFSAKAFAEAKAEYQMASARFEDSYETEKPAHAVTLTKPYYLGRFEVTQEQYQQVMSKNPSGFKGANLPVETVSWDDAQEFCKKTSARTEQTVRLPTSAEWEYACRAGTRTTFCTGDGNANFDRAAWFLMNSSDTTHPVGQKMPNAWGLHDMHGNVCEWCKDWYAPDKAEAAVDPQGPAQGECRVLRGGAWNDGPDNCRSAVRMWISPGGRDGFIGFRVASDVPPKAP